VVTLGFQFASSLSTLEKYLKYWAIFFLVIVITLVLVLKNKLEKMIEE
jgi:membrane protein DedA with SNARE-associated domain